MVIAAVLLLAGLAPVAGGGDAVAAEARKTGRDTGLPIPRFVSLRANTVNMRAGPGLRYPIEWVYKRRGLPVAVIKEFNAWRRVRAADGTTGWMHAAMLDGKRTAQVVGRSLRALLADPEGTAESVALVQPGALGELDRCKGSFCHVDLGRHAGWLPREAIYGLLPNERLD
jgi:SH3-like domain-containing protein